MTTDQLTAEVLAELHQLAEAVKATDPDLDPDARRQALEDLYDATDIHQGSEPVLALVAEEGRWVRRPFAVDVVWTSATTVAVEVYDPRECLWRGVPCTPETAEAVAEAERRSLFEAGCNVIVDTSALKL